MMLMPFSRAPEIRAKTSATVVLVAMVCAVLLNIALDGNVHNSVLAPCTVTLPEPLMSYDTVLSVPKL